MIKLKKIVLFGISVWAISFIVSQPMDAISQEFKHTPAESNQQVTAILIIDEFATTFQTETGMLVSSALPSLISISLSGNQHKWIQVVTDTTLAFPEQSKKFLMSGYILDYFDEFRINLNITSKDIPGARENIFAEVYSISTDSILTRLGEISREIASVLYEHVSDFEEKYEPSLLIYPFENVDQDSSLNGLAEYIASSLLFELEITTLVSKVKVVAAGAEADRITETFDLALSGYFKALKGGDSILVSAIFTDPKRNKPVYSVTIRDSMNNILELSTSLFDDLSGFLLVFRDIRGDLLANKSAKGYFKQGEKYLNDLDDPSGITKAEIMYLKALEIDSQYIPAMTALGTIFMADMRYEDTFSIYSDILKIDSLHIEAHLGFGEYYYNTYDDELALEHFLYAGELGMAADDKASSSLAYRRIAELSSANSDYDKAITYYEQALQLADDDIWIWHGIASAHYYRYTESTEQIRDTTDVHLALKYFHKGMELFPDDSSFARNTGYIVNYWGEAYYNEYGRMLYDPSATEEERKLFLNLAQKKFEEGSQIESHDNDVNARSFGFLAKIAEINYEREDAKKYSKAAIQLNPSDEWPYRLFAYYHRKDTLNIGEALGSINRALSISENAYSYEILGDIYVTMAIFDSAYNAYRTAIDSGGVSLVRLEDLSRSAKMTGNPENIRGAIDYLKNGLVSAPTVRSYLEWLVKLGKIDKQYDNVAAALNEYLRHEVSESDSLWVFVQLAELSMERSEYKKSLDFVKQALKISPTSSDAFSLMDSLYFADSYPAAIELKISIMEENLKDNGTSPEFIDLAYALLTVDLKKKSLDAIDLAFQSSMTKYDTAIVYNVKSLVYSRLGQDAYDEKDTTAGRLHMLEAINFANKAINLYPDWAAPLSTLQFIYHEYIVDYEKSYTFCKTLLSIDSLNISYITNYIESMLTTGRFDSAFAMSKNILEADSIATQSLDPELELAITFVHMASNVLRGERMKGYSDFGGFRRLYLRRSEQWEARWLWSGTKHFLQTYKDVNSSYRLLLLDIIKVLESEKEDGLALLQEVEVTWNSLMSEAK